MSSGLSQIGGSEMELLVFLKLSALEKDCSFVNLPGGSLSDIPRLLQMIKYKLYLRQSATQKKTHLFQLFKNLPRFSRWTVPDSFAPITCLPRVDWHRVVSLRKVS